MNRNTYKTAPGKLQPFRHQAQIDDEVLLSESGQYRLCRVTGRRGACHNKGGRLSGDLGKHQAQVLQLRIQEKDTAINKLRCPRMFAAKANGIKFFYECTLKRTWNFFGIVRPVRSKKPPVILEHSESLCLMNPSYRMALTTIHACGLRISEGTRLTTCDIDGKRNIPMVRNNR